MGCSRMIGRLAEHGITAVDLLPVLQETEGKRYWERDYHLAPSGQAAVAEAFHASFADMIPRK